MVWLQQCYSVTVLQFTWRIYVRVTVDWCTARPDCTAVFTSEISHQSVLAVLGELGASMKNKTGYAYCYQDPGCVELPLPQSSPTPDASWTIQLKCNQ